MRAALIISSCLLVLLFYAFGAEMSKGQTPEGLEMITPLDGTSTFSEEIFVVAFVPDSLASDVQLLTERGPIDVRMEGSFAHGTVRLALGPNVIRVEARGGGGVLNMTEARIFRKARYGSEFGSYAEQYRFHAPGMEARCAGCHIMIQDPDSSNVTAMPDPVCWKCHFEKAFQRYTHSSLRDGGCFVCHERQGEPAYSVGSEAGELCLSCHKELRALEDKGFVHGPVIGGECEVCHDPHGSRYESHVRMRVADLCVMCHESVRAETMMKGAHLPFREGDCLRCHVSHWSDRESGLVDDPAILCEQCHRIEPLSPAHPHPGVTKPTTEAGRGLPWIADGKLQCISCHNPHAAEMDGLLRASLDEGCNGCHTK